ncbi:MAG: hypothetical protein FWG11_03180 [Promicromonosporaceae bacterium]|nr:hypothetical protein [Promicromonosporaceae bacterium]
MNVTQTLSTSGPGVELLFAAPAAVLIGALVAAPPLLWASLFPQRRMRADLLTLRETRSLIPDSGANAVEVDEIDTEIRHLRCFIKAEQQYQNFKYHEMLSYCFFVALLLVSVAMAVIAHGYSHGDYAWLAFTGLALAGTPVLNIAIKIFGWNRRMTDYISYLASTELPSRAIRHKANHLYLRAITSHLIMCLVGASAILLIVTRDGFWADTNSLWAFSLVMATLTLSLGAVLIPGSLAVSKRRVTRLLAKVRGPVDAGTS